MLKHKFKNSFQDTLNPFCSSDLDVETNPHFFLCCPLFSNQRCTLLSTVNDIDNSLTNTNDSILTHNCNNELYQTNEQNFLLYFHLFNFFPYPYVFLLRLYIHIHLVLRFTLIYLLTLFFYILFLFISRCLLNV